MIGKKLTPVLKEIEKTLWEWEVDNTTKPDYTTDGFRACTKIFMSALMDKIWELQESENINFDNRIEMVKKAGNDVRNLIKIYTDIDCHKLY